MIILLHVAQQQRPVYAHICMFFITICLMLLSNQMNNTEWMGWGYNGHGNIQQTSYISQTEQHSSCCSIRGMKLLFTCSGESTVYAYQTCSLKATVVVCSLQHTLLSQVQFWHHCYTCICKCTTYTCMLSTDCYSTCTMLVCGKSTVKSVDFVETFIVMDVAQGDMYWVGTGQSMDKWQRIHCMQWTQRTEEDGCL